MAFDHEGDYDYDFRSLESPPDRLVCNRPPCFTVTTVVLVIVIAIQTAMLLSSYYTTTDLSLTRAKSHIMQLQNDIRDLKAKSANCKSGELTQTESKLNHLLSLLKSAYPYISKRDDESLWPLKLFVSDEISDQVAPDAILKMSDFAKRKENKEQWYSKPFYAFQQGYQMCLSVYADGTDDGEGTHVSVYLYLMKGPHDDELEQSGYWPLNGIFTIELLNQLNNSDHKMTLSPSTPNNTINRVVNDINAVWGYPRFISHGFLLHHSKVKYLCNDTLYFRISYQNLYWQKVGWGMIVGLFILIVITIAISLLHVLMVAN